MQTSPLVAVLPQWAQRTGSGSCCGPSSRRGSTSSPPEAQLPVAVLGREFSTVLARNGLIMTSEAAQPGLGVGTWAWGNQFLWGYDPKRDDAALEATFRRCLELGLVFFDTADSYGTGRLNGRSEELLGRFASQCSPGEQERLCIATKLAPFPWRLGRRGYDRAFAASQRRLQGHLKRVQLHWSTARYAPWQEPALLEGLADLVSSGAVPSLGVSNMGPRRLRQVHQQLAARGIRLSSLQVQLSLLAPEAVQPGGVAEVCRELGIELIAYSPLALGLLGRSASDPRPIPQGPRGALFRRLEPRLAPLRQAMEEISQGRPGGLGAVALNWCRSHGAMPIPGMRSTQQVEAAASALSWSLSGEERLRLDQLAMADGAARMPANPFQSA